MKNVWKKPSEALGSILADAVADLDCQPRKMFGCPCYFVNNNMFAGVHEDNLILRLSPEDREAIAAEHDEVGHFEPMAGRPMREYMALPEPVDDEEATLLRWVDRAYAFAASLPPKEKKTRKKK